MADHPLALGLAGASGGRSLGLDGWGASQGAPGGSVLVFWDHLWWPALERDGAAWVQSLQELERLVADLLGEFAAGRIRLVLLDDGESYRFALDRFSFLSFWRRRGTLRDWISRCGPGSHPPG